MIETMKDSHLATALAKVIVAAAWADGTIQPEERECFEDLLFQLPDLPTERWQELKALLDTPVHAKARAAYVNELKDAMQVEGATDFIGYALDRIVSADGVVTESEKELVRTVEAALASGNGEKVNFSTLIDGPLERRAETHRLTQSEGCELEDYLRDKYDAYVEANTTPPFTQNDQHKFVLGGILMARVVKADDRIDEEEKTVVSHFLRERWRLTEKDADRATDIALDDEVAKFDIIRVCRLFYELTTEAERVQFLDILFKVALVDGRLTDTEVDEVLNITANLKLEQSYFQQALLRAGVTPSGFAVE
ncbi:MAG: TerB family tellurite resistance protein [Opitutales bacterium]